MTFIAQRKYGARHVEGFSDDSDPHSAYQQMRRYYQSEGHADWLSCNAEPYRRPIWFWPSVVVAAVTLISIAAAWVM